MADMINAYKILIGNPEGKKLLRRLRRRWDDNMRHENMKNCCGKCVKSCGGGQCLLFVVKTKVHDL
jgi:hypothetical protein